MRCALVVQVRWLKDGEVLDVVSDANLILSNDASLIISQARVSDSGNYSCLAQNIAARRRSAVARLTVYGQCARDQSHAMSPGFYRAGASYASAVLGVVILSVRTSVRHTRAL